MKIKKGYIWDSNPHVHVRKGIALPLQPTAAANIVLLVNLPDDCVSCSSVEKLFLVPRWSVLIVYGGSY